MSHQVPWAALLWDEGNLWYILDQKTKGLKLGFFRDSPLPESVRIYPPSKRSHIPPHKRKPEQKQKQGQLNGVATQNPGDVRFVEAFLSASVSGYLVSAQTSSNDQTDSGWGLIQGLTIWSTNLDTHHITSRVWSKWEFFGGCHGCPILNGKIRGYGGGRFKWLEHSLRVLMGWMMDGSDCFCFKSSTYENFTSEGVSNYICVSIHFWILVMDFLGTALGAFRW